jgi:hypothetical protein
MSDKIYCGSGKRVGNYGTIAVSICLDDIPSEYKQKSKNGKTYVNIRVDEKREVDQYGKSHTVTVDTWKPDGQRQAQAPVRQAPVRQAPIIDDKTEDLLPF